MSKLIHPPPNYQCLYRHSCPHLDLLSTTWVFGEYRRGERRYQEHLRVIDRFQSALKSRDEKIRIPERENAEIKAKLKMLHQRQFKANISKEDNVKKRTARLLTAKSVAHLSAIPDGREPNRNVLTRQLMYRRRRNVPIAATRIS